MTWSWHGRTIALRRAGTERRRQEFQNHRQDERARRKGVGRVRLRISSLRIQSRMSDLSLSTVGRGQGQPSPASGEGVAVDWAEVRRAYELSGETVASIIRRFGLSREALRRRRVGGRWTTRPPAAQPGPRQDPRRSAARRSSSGSTSWSRSGWRCWRNAWRRRG